MPLDAETIFEIGSISKVFTAILLADMAADGLLALEDPVQTLAPDGVTIEKELEGHGDWVNALCPLGERLYSGAATGPLREW